jgi:hypothetical protein
MNPLAPQGRKAALFCAISGYKAGVIDVGQQTAGVSAA